MAISKKKPRAGVSRRDFLKASGLAVGGIVAGATGASFLIPKSKVEVPRAGGHIVQVSFDESACTGCGTCELVCAAVHGGSVGPSLRRIWLARDAIDLIHSVLSCQQCNFPGCYYACPHRDEALYIDSSTGARCINPDRCQSGCHRCIEACLFDPPRINYDAESSVCLICDLCRDRASGPACVEFCPAQCLRLEETERS